MDRIGADGGGDFREMRWKEGIGIRDGEVFGWA